MEINLIKILKEEHQMISDILDEIEIASDLENKKILIKKILNILMSHLKREDEELYPALEKSKDEEVVKMAKIFSETMKGYAEDFFVVTEKILSLTGDIPLDIDLESKKIYERLKDRVIIEEVTIFPAYEKSLSV